LRVDAGSNDAAMIGKEQFEFAIKAADDDNQIYGLLQVTAGTITPTSAQQFYLEISAEQTAF
jgi:hypothetical protein